MTEVLTQKQLNRALLARQSLLTRANSIEEVMEAHVALQTQEPEPPYISLWSRVNGFQREAYDKMMLERKLIRATTLRGTIHTSTVNDYLMIRSETQEVFTRKPGSHLNGHRPEVWGKQIATALSGKRFGGPELRRLLLEKFGELTDERFGNFWAHMVIPFVRVPRMEGGDFGGSRDLWMNAEEWIGQSVPEASTRNLMALVRRYLSGFGPATPGDFTAWSGIPGASRVFKLMENELSTFKDERGRRLYDLPNAPRPDEDVPAPTRIFGEFDNLNLGHGDRTRITDDNFRRSYNMSFPGRNMGTFTLDGRVEGMWKIDKASSVLTAEYAGNHSQLTLEAAQEEFVRFGRDLYDLALDVRFKRRDP